ncbi:RagB/SusD family nutrient uptake outer membrane protein [Paraflavitalea pollutisoli]|uniref:RagB/SusD family nutrient uptake outer membrane protein n=1 Tax=Paraflavitalea pollutisoli TaxID=3034143 RepID=UPI0023ED26C2|nr:RagB/SusD family nutrient uptake outer membrane protein [Paraflavitalea sp. H1-2-19X]
MKSLHLIQRCVGLLGSLCLLVFATGCKKDWLNVKPDKSQAIPTRLSDYRAMLNHTSVLNANCIALGEVASDGHYVSDAIWTATKDIPAINAYTWSQSTVYPDMESYRSFYNRIFFTNVVMDGLRKLTVTTAAERAELDGLRARALFVKAISYYWLSQLYAQPYRAATAATDQGILAQDNLEFLENVHRLTVAETYNSIITMLTEALPLLPVKPAHVTQASRPAVHALLSRVYLCMQDYDNALLHANSSLELQPALLDYSKVPAGNFYIGAFNSEVLYHDEMSSSEINSFTTNNCLLDRSLYDSYHADDLRKTLYFFPLGANLIFKGNYNNSNWQIFCGLANDEVYLTRAECQARKGDAAAAMKGLNDLLRTRWKTNTDGSTLYTDRTAADANDALLQILAERKKSLLVRGTRWADLRRLNLAPATAVTLTRTIGGKTYSIEPNSHRYTFPLPITVRELGGHAQTTGWE